MTVDAYRVLIIDDDFRVGGLHRDIVVGRPGFAALEPVRGVREARAAVRDQQPDLLLCDVYLPDGDGIGFVAESDVDAIVISAATDAPTVRRALRAGALDYLVKPFDARLLGDRLDAYRRFRNVLGDDRRVDQETLERALQVLRGRETGAGSTAQPATERLILERLGEGEASANDIAERIGVSRATAQRHLAALAARGAVEVSLRYGTTGRPEHRYRGR
ncbi:response regulator [Microbacterium sp. P02]|uniref:response regulator n=1 Tax=Microbacterium sp. P02 TaxID=3366260 RepID=UPI00366C317D